MRFRFRSAEIASGVRCNCSICIRKGTIGSAEYIAPDDFESPQGFESLAVYRWGDHQVNFYFCKTCGIHTFHEGVATPGHYRLNLGCVDGLDPLALEISLIDGKSFPVRK